MEKIIPVINWIKKNIFWLTCGALSIAMIASWFVSDSGVAGQTSKAKQKIEGKVNLAKGLLKKRPDDIKDVTTHPNDSTIAGMNAEIEESIESLEKAWDMRFTAQKAVRSWPAEVLKDPTTVQLFSQFDPPETFPADDPGRRMISFLNIYKQQIPARMPELASKIKTNWMYDDEGVKKEVVSETTQKGIGVGVGQGAGRGDRGQGDRGDAASDDESDDEKEEPKQIVVYWDDGNQQLWHGKLTNFSGDGNTLEDNTPSPLQVFMLQQDLWLLESMFDVIGAMNDGYTANDLAIIKRIDHIAFGREAIAQLGQLTSGSSGKDLAAGPGSSTDVRGNRKARSSNKSTFNAGAEKSPVHGRYVDTSFGPIAASEVVRVINGKDLPEKNLELIVARRIPFRAAFLMNEKSIPKFIAECAKSPFAFEINQLRINKHKPGEGIENVKEGVSNRRSTREGDMGAQGIGSTGGDSNKNSGDGGRSSGDAPIIAETRTNFDVKVEFYGIVKIYNPVDLKRLRGEDGNSSETASANTNQNPSGKP